MAVARHEPFQAEYILRTYFNDFYYGKPLEPTDEIKRHMEEIEEILESKFYIESGWPVYGFLPYLL